MNIVDSSGWLEYFAGTPNAKNFSACIKNSKKLLIPSIILYEVFKKILQERDQATALEAIASMKEGVIAPCTEATALLAAMLSHEHKIPMADSIILATAREHNATVWTQDKDFEGIEGVNYFAKP